MSREIINSPLTRGVRETIPFILNISNWPQGTFSNPAVVIEDSSGNDVSGSALTGSATISETSLQTPDFVSEGLSTGFYKMFISWQVDGDTVEAWADLQIED